LVLLFVGGPNTRATQLGAPFIDGRQRTTILSILQAQRYVIEHFLPPPKQKAEEDATKTNVFALLFDRLSLVKDVSENVKARSFLVLHTLQELVANDEQEILNLFKTTNLHKGDDDGVLFVPLLRFSCEIWAETSELYISVKGSEDKWGVDVETCDSITDLCQRILSLFRSPSTRFD